MFGVKTPPTSRDYFDVGRHLWRQNLKHFSNNALKHGLQESARNKFHAYGESRRNGFSREPQTLGVETLPTNFPLATR